MPHVSQLEDDLQVNAIERLREGIRAVDADGHLLGLQQKEAKRVQDAFDALAAVEALYQAAKNVVQPFGNDDVLGGWDGSELLAAVRRVEGEA